ncbi:MAG: hypothetical protein D6765_14975, partial [Bacteroidetes bacterium]
MPTRLLFFLALFLAAPHLGAQDSLSLEQCYAAALQRAPILQNHPLLNRLESLLRQQVEAGRLPSLELKAEGAYQSESIRLDFPAPVPVEPVEVPRHRAQLYIEGAYRLYDGGRADAAAAKAAAGIATARAELEVQVDRIRDSVRRLFFQVLRLRAQRAIVVLGRRTLQERLAAARNAVDNGVLLPGALLELETQLQQTESTLLQLDIGIAAAFDGLTLLT